MAVTPRGGEPDSSNRQREALERALRDARLTSAEAARQAKLKTPNALYNFLGGRTRSLSVSTLAELAKVIPGATIASLRGDETNDTRTVTVRARAQAGTLRSSFDLPPGDQEQVPVPINPSMRAAGAYGVRSLAPGAELIYPDNSILVVMPVSAFEGVLSGGKRVIMQRIRDNQVEVTVRELEVRDGKAWLWPRSSDPRHTQPIEMPWPFPGDRMWKRGDERFSIAGIVIGSYRPET